jgi:DNA-binding LacI/PurR family transcriptional regulator
VAYLTPAPGPPDDAFLQSCAAFGIEGRRVSPREFASPVVAARALYQQGFAGLILDEPSLWPPEEAARFAWQRFALVKLARGRADLPCHVVRHSAFDYMDTTLREVTRCGYRRLAVLLYRSHCERDNDARLGALLAFAARRRRDAPLIQWRELTDLSSLCPPTARWLQRFQPDAILAYHWCLIHPLRELGYRFPGPIGLAAVLGTRQRLPELPAVSGCDSDERQAMRRAVETLVRLFTHGQRGFPSFPLEQVIEPCWVNGETLPLRERLPAGAEVPTNT